jgi:hypothetical protein
MPYCDNFFILLYISLSTFFLATILIVCLWNVIFKQKKIISALESRVDLQSQMLSGPAKPQ